jgi:hypothetical protein
MVSKQVLTFKGTLWRSEASPFGIVRAEWTEQTDKGSSHKTETKRLTWLDGGREEPSAQPVDRGRDFSVWRLIFGR